MSLSKIEKLLIILKVFRDFSWFFVNLTRFFVIFHDFPLTLLNFSFPLLFSCIIFIVYYLYFQIHPHTLKPVKRLKKPPPKLPDSSSFVNLGGIFGIDNGWDKTEEKKLQDVGKLPPIPKKVQPGRELPKINVLLSVDHDELEASYNAYFEMCNADMAGK